MVHARGRCNQFCFLGRSVATAIFKTCPLLFLARANDSDEKVLELTRNVQELQRMVRESSDRYAALEDNQEKERDENLVELKRRNETIRSLNKELEDSQVLVKTLEHRGTNILALERNVTTRVWTFNCFPSRQCLTSI